MATINTWAITAENAPAHVGRLLASAVLNEGVVDKAGGSFQVTEDTGANMQVQVGSGTVGDLVAIQGDAQAGQGVYVAEHQDPTATLVIAASDPSNDRIDRVVARVYDDEADSSGLDKTDIEVVEGTPAASPSAPAVPAGSISLAQILVGAGVTAITDAVITDERAESTVQQDRVPTLRLPTATFEEDLTNPAAVSSRTKIKTLNVPDPGGEVDVVVICSINGRYTSGSDDLKVEIEIGTAGDYDLQGEPTLVFHPSVFDDIHTTWHYTRKTYIPGGSFEVNVYADPTSGSWGRTAMWITAYVIPTSQF